MLIFIDKHGESIYHDYRRCPIILDKLTAG